MRRVLLTGFEPFGGARLNPSWEAVRLAVAEPPEAVELFGHLLPCRFRVVVDELWAAVERYDPDVVVCVGLAGGRAQVSVERIAVNVDDARMPDNAGAQPIDEPIEPYGPAAYFATLPVKACVAAVRSRGIPAGVSQTAGTFVCNHVFYGLLHRAALRGGGRPRGGFVHVPYAPEQVTDGGQPSLPVPLAAVALRAVATTAAYSTVDIRLPGGSLS
jgi:pyroglutamyl-peptidase